MSNAQAVVTRDEATGVAPVIQSETAAILSMIERLATNPAADIDKIMKLMEMRERIQMKQAETAFNAAMAAAQSELQPVAKKLKNEHTKANYADLDSIYEMAKPKLLVMYASSAI
jgi:DNA-binding FadR family transcriptional regulator